MGPRNDAQRPNTDEEEEGRHFYQRNHGRLTAAAEATARVNCTSRPRRAGTNESAHQNKFCRMKCRRLIVFNMLFRPFYNTNRIFVVKTILEHMETPQRRQKDAQV
jgi:hypothetical protein